MAGTSISEIEANSASEQFKRNTYLEPEERNIFRFFRKGVRFYTNYFDYIVMDSAPAMEGNILCQLAAHTAMRSWLP